MSLIHARQMSSFWFGLLADLHECSTSEGLGRARAARGCKNFLLPPDRSAVDKALKAVFNTKTKAVDALRRLTGSCSTWRLDAAD